MQVQALRCSHCGAPLSSVGEEQFIKCEFCGTTQQRIDIEKYISQLRADVYGWVRSLVPSVVTAVENVDPIARAQIYEQSIRGEVNGRLNSIGFQLVKVAAGPLFLPPYTRPFLNMLNSTSLDSKDLLSQGAKFQGLSPFAQSEDQTSHINRAVAISETLGYISNVIRIYADPLQRSYSTISRNFDNAALSLEKDKLLTGASLRMRGLATLSAGVSLLNEGDLSKAETKFSEADRTLSASLIEVTRQATTASWYPGVKAEKLLVEAMKYLAESVRISKAFHPSQSETLARFASYVRGFESARLSSGKNLSTSDRLDPETFKDLTMSFRDVCLARTGNPVINGLGSGRLFVGCWLADVSYSFETGVLFMKKGQAVQERMLVSGTFTFHPHYIWGSSHFLVTDIFAARLESTFSDRIMGREVSLTTGTGYSALAPRRLNLSSSTPVLPPLSTRAEAEKMANIYLEKVRQRLMGKLRIGIPSVNQLVYVGGNVTNGWLEIPGLPSWMFPYVGDERTISAFSV